MDDSPAGRAARHIVRLVGFAVLAALAISASDRMTGQRIADNERRYILRTLNTVLPPDRYDNDLTLSTIERVDSDLLGSAEPVLVYVATQDNQPVGFIFAPIAPDGYSGPINLLVGIYADGTVSGVRVTAHRETPGLGDGIDRAKSDWIDAFAGRSLDAPPLQRWAIRRDAGEFDQLTGATITPRAVVKAVRNTLLYFREHRSELIAAPQNNDQ